MTDHYPNQYLYKRLVQARLFIDANFAQPIDLQNIAGEACFSRFHFIRLFKQTYGQTPHQYLTSVRMANARALLQKGKSVSDACFMSGYDSLTSFTALFRRNTGCTPSAYQHQARQRQEQITAAPLHFVPACFAQQKGWLQESQF